jgi:Transposase DDE domain
VSAVGVADVGAGIREPSRRQLALVTNDPTTAAEQVIERYAARWAIEVAFADAKQITGVGEARNRTRPAVDAPCPSDLWSW